MGAKKAARGSGNYTRAKERHSGRTGVSDYSTEYERGCEYAAWVVGIGFGLMLFMGVMFGW